MNSIKGVGITAGVSRIAQLRQQLERCARNVSNFSLAVELVSGLRDGSSATQPCLASRPISLRRGSFKEHAKQNAYPPYMRIPLMGRALHSHLVFALDRLHGTFVIDSAATRSR